jgi:hypothetical protein
MSTQKATLFKEPAGHHLVSKFYLRHFAKNESIRVLSKARWKSYSTSIEKAARRTNFYSRELPDGTRSLDMERWIGDIEGRVGIVLKKALTGKLPSPSERPIVAAFVALQIARSNEWRSVLGDSLIEFRRTLAELSNADSLGIPTYDDIHVMVKNIHMEEIAESVHSFAQALLRRKCWMLAMFDSPSLLSSDSPVVILPFGIGLNDAEVVTFPIAAGCALMMLKAGSMAPLINGSSLMARDINLHVAGQAEDLVFMHPDVDYRLYDHPLLWTYEQ